MPRLRTSLALALATTLAGCSFFTGEPKRQPQTIEYSCLSPYPTVRTIAIAPAINLSGSRDFDPLVVSDTLYAEAQQVQNLNVLPVNKTLLAMQRLHIRALDDPQTAQRLAQALGADGLIIPAVTAYDPYNPPIVGMVLQMYTPPAAAPVAATVSAEATLPVASNAGAVRANPDRPTLVADVAPAPPAPLTDKQPVSQVSAVFNATNQSVLRELKTFASGRTQYDSAMMDQKFLLDSDAYMRFVCHAMIRRLMDVERDRLADR